MDKEKVVDRILGSFLPKDLTVTRAGIARLRQPVKRKMGTTVVALKFKDGVLIAADRRTSWGHKIMSDETVKVESVSVFTGVGCSGSVSDSQYVKSILERVNMAFALRAGVPLTIEGQANYVADLLHKYYLYGLPLSVEMIICGLNFFGIFQIFEIWEDGCREERDYSAVGSGTFEALGVMEEYKKKISDSSLDLNDAVDVAVRAICKSGKWNSGVSPVQLVLPSVATVTVTGFNYVEDKAVELSRSRILSGG